MYIYYIYDNQIDNLIFLAVLSDNDGVQHKFNTFPVEKLLNVCFKVAKAKSSLFVIAIDMCSLGSRLLWQ